MVKQLERIRVQILLLIRNFFRHYKLIKLKMESHKDSNKKKDENSEV